MKLQQKQNGEIEIFELSGELDFHNTPQVRDKVHEVLSKQAKKVVFNLKGVTYIDSSGLAVFVETLQKMKRYGGKLVLSELAAPVRSVFEIAKLDKVFTLAGTETEAVQTVSQ